MHTTTTGWDLLSKPKVVGKVQASGACLVPCPGTWAVPTAVFWSSDEPLPEWLMAMPGARATGKTKRT